MSGTKGAFHDNVEGLVAYTQILEADVERQELEIKRLKEAVDFVTKGGG